MKYYLVQYEHGNYHPCPWCSSTNKEKTVHEYKSDEDAIKYFKRYNDANNSTQDSLITDAYVLADENPVFKL